MVLSDCLGFSELSPDVHLAEATNNDCKCVYSLHTCVPVLLGTAYQESECSISHETTRLNEICFCFGALIFTRNRTWLESDLQNNSTVSFRFIEFLDDWINEEITVSSKKNIIQHILDAYLGSGTV